MGKLSNLKPAVGSLAPKVHVETLEQRRRVYEQTRSANVEWRAWYKTKQWFRLRHQVLVRDLFTCQQTGVLLSGKYPAPNSPVVDHKVPHRGDPGLFWDINNLQAVSREWHDTVKHAIEMGGHASPHPDWFQPSVIPLTIVCGPPASGKSTYIRDRAGPSDLIIDIDMIASGMAGTESHGWDRERYLNAAIYRRNDIIGSLSRPSKHKAAWLIVGEPKAKWRAWWERKLKPIEIVVIETPERMCVERVKADPGRPYKDNTDGIVRWWLEYDRRRGDTVIAPPGGR